MDPLDPFNQMMNPTNPLSPLFPHVVAGQQERRIPDGQGLALLLAAFAVALGLLVGGVWLIAQ